MISFNWVITMPKHLNETSFDKWYLGKHTEYAKVGLNMVRYAINRRVKKQPAAAHGDFFRIAQEYWASWDEMVACWNHHTGYTLLGDGLAYMGLDPGTLPGIALTEETQFDVAQPAVFSPIRRGYRGRADGTITKFIVFGMAKDKSKIKSWYAKRHGKLGMDPLVREHTFGIGVGKVIEFGYVGKLPSGDMLSYDWNLELWFDSNAEALKFLASKPFIEMFDDLKGVSHSTLAGLFRGQEMLMTNRALAHKDE